MPTEHHPIPSIGLDIEWKPNRKLKRSLNSSSTDVSISPKKSCTEDDLNSARHINTSSSTANNSIFEISHSTSFGSGGENESFNISDISVTSDIQPICTCSKKVMISFGTQYENPIPTINSETQWQDPSMLDHNYSKQRVLKTVLSHSIAVQVEMHDYHRVSNKDCKFYTGLDLVRFEKLVKVLSLNSIKPPCSMEIRDQIFLVLMKLRLNLLFEDLGRRFYISGSLAGRIFKYWLDVMYQKLSDLICWLPRETIYSTSPKTFKVNYPLTTCVIDCTEVFVQRSRKLRARALTYSNYKSHNTMKAFTAIAPNGYIMFISRCYGGRTSDNFITRDCGFYKYLLPGDEVMADRGFTIAEDLEFIKVKLNIPAFTRGKDQLDEEDVTKTRRIATVRIEVERVIGKLKNFRILKEILPLTFAKKVDKIMTVCGALCNLQATIAGKSSRNSTNEIQSNF